MIILSIGHYKSSDLYSEEPQLAGGGFDTVQTDEGTWLVYPEVYFTYNKTTGEFNSSISYDLSI